MVSIGWFSGAGIPTKRQESAWRKGQFGENSGFVKKLSFYLCQDECTPERPHDSMATLTHVAKYMRQSKNLCCEREIRNL